MKPQDKFLVEVLGKEGAMALKKATEREPVLAQAILPRAILGWLSNCSTFSYEDVIPGIDNSYLAFKKSQDGNFTGTITFETGNYQFENAPVTHLSAAVAMALGANVDNGIDTNQRAIVWSRLGSSIDTLAKAQVVTKKLKVSKVELPGKTAQPTPQDEPLKPIPPGSQDLGGAKKSKLKFKLPRVPKTTAKIPPISIGKSECSTECDVCGLALFSGNKFKGCLCCDSLVKSVRTIAYSDGFVFELGPEIDEEEATTLMRILRSKNE